MGSPRCPRLLGIHCGVLWRVLLVLSGMTSLVQAQIQPAERATAEALFQRGVSLMDEEQYAEACKKFEGALAIERGLGTMLHLADCYDRAGKTASAWALFHELKSLAQSNADDVRAQIAEQRATDLQQRLSLLKLTFADDFAPQDVRIELSGSLIPEATWDAPIPVDPGRQKIVVSAPEHELWSNWVEIESGPSVRKLLIPKLRALSRAAAAPPPSKPAEAQSTSLSSRSPAVAADQAPTSGSTQRTWGVVTTSIGIAGLGVAGFLGYRANQLNDQSLAQCRPENTSACNADGVRLRKEARDYANGATLAAAVGGAALLGGLGLLIWAPDGSSSAEQQTRLVPAIDPWSARMIVKGAF